MTFHISHINEVYSNADGTIQFIEFVVDQGSQHQWAGHSLSSTDGVDTNTYDFMIDLPSSATAGKSVLVATQGFADLGLVTPDYIIPDGFFFTDGGTVNFPGMDSLNYAAMPTDGTHSLDGNGATGTNSPTNFAGDAGTIPGNPIVGTASTDNLAGTGSNDFIVGIGASDTLDGGAGADTLIGGAGGDTLSGGAGADSIDGGTGNDSLDGTGGGDTMLGGTGNDTYFVNVAADVVMESAGAGTDTVRSSVTYTLGPNVDKLLLTGTSAINGAGNGLANTLTGNSGNNVLKGGAGNDRLIGGGGNDTLVWDPLDGSIQGGGGSDTLRVDGSGKVIDLTLIANTRITNVEIINLRGSGDNTLTVGLNDVLAISSATDTLRVTGNAGDIVKAGTGWAHGADQVIGSNTYDTYTKSTATLLVDSDITQNIVA